MATQLILIFALVMFTSTVRAQPAYGTGCGLALEDIPNPASETCTAFFRCYRNRQYSLRCPLGQAFDFDKSRCRPDREIDCPLQLQRFQAPAVPAYLRPPGQNQQEREIEIRVVQVPPGVDPNSIQITGNVGRLAPTNNRPVFTNQFPSLLNTHTRTGIVQQQQPPTFNAGVQGPGQYIPGQVTRGQFVPPQPQAQVPLVKPQQAPLQPAEGQPGQDGLNILVPQQAQEVPQ
uniref:Chitin-binding type-2 domain-containing protein n=1 Tax=Biomphalaria glabrata TaxID=6526 RepID=A0A2C9LPY5_BIOGL